MESTFSFTTKVNGDLFTVRGNTLDEFMQNIGSVQANLQGILNDLTVIQAGGHAAPLVNTQAPAPQPVPQAAPPQQWQSQPAPQQAPQQWGPPPQQPQQGGWQQPAPSGHRCECGLDMKLRSGRNGQFYSCPKRMDDPTRCRKTLNV